MPSNTPPTTDLEAQVAKKVQKTTPKPVPTIPPVPGTPGVGIGVGIGVRGRMGKKPKVAKPGMSRRNRGPL